MEGFRRARLAFTVLTGLVLICSFAAAQTVVASHTFDDGSTAGWIPRGSVSLRAVTDVSRSGAMSLRATGRTAGWHGPSLDLTDTLKKGGVYEIAGWVRLAAGQPESRLKFTVQRGSNQYDQVNNPVPVTDREWVLVHGRYTFTEDAQLLLYLESDDPTSAYYLDDFSITTITPPPVGVAQERVEIQDLPPLYAAFGNAFSIGAAIEPYQTRGPHAEMLTRHFDTITAENAMKPGPIQPTEGEFNWSGADEIAKFARENGMKMRFHTLQWHSQAADWMFLDENGRDMTAETDPVRRERNKRLLLERLETHIRTVVSRYRDVVFAWDVVNEVIDTAAPDGLRRSTWYQITGTEYIETAFRTAREAAGPTAKLFINDYGTEAPNKRDALYALVVRLLENGVPVDGVGHQMHVNIQSPSMALVADSIRKFASIGLDNQLTELDMSVYADSSVQTEPTEEQLLMQAYRYKDLFDTLVSLRDYVSNVTFWGIGDDHTWLSTRTDVIGRARPDWPLLFDANLQAKPAFWALVDPAKLPMKIKNVNGFKGTPVVDGQPELVWNVVSPVPAGTGASFRTLWDDSRLYLFAEFSDARPERGDTIEVFIDPDNSKSAAYDAADRRLVFDRTGRTVSGTGTAGVSFAIEETQGGYRLEASVPAAGLAQDRKVGLDVRFTDAGTGNRLSWNDLRHGQDGSTAAFGTVTLLPQTRITTAVRGTPVIDAVEDPVWAGAEEIATDVIVSGPRGATARVKTLWDDGALYVYAKVNDPLLTDASANPWEEDSIEVFLDPNHARTEIYQPDDAQYRVNYRNVQSYAGAANAGNFTTAARTVDGGYVIEAALTLERGVLAEGKVLGFDFQVNDDRNGDGARDSVMIWNDPTGQSYLNTTRFGALVLSGRR